MQAGDHRGLPGAGGNDVLRPRAVEKAGLAPFIPVESTKAVELRLYGEIFLWAEGADFLFALHDQRERRRLHAPSGELCVVLAGERAGHIEAHEPIRLCAALSGAIKAVVFCGRPEMGKPLPNGFIRLGGDPEPFCFSLPTCLLHDPAGDQLSLAAGVCWIVGIGDLENIHYSRVSSAPMNL